MTMPTNARPMTSTVREASPTDVVELARLRWEFRGDDQSVQAQSDFMQDCEAWLLEAIPSGRWVISVAASETGSLLGCMFLQCIEKVPTPGEIRRSWGYVTNCYVAIERRGIGVGRRLLDLLIDVARARRLEFLIVWPSEKAVSFYQRAGFQPTSEVHAGPDDEPPMELVL
jgi:ribosomal protein S18 acetylase RimI-like enzyme